MNQFNLFNLINSFVDVAVKLQQNVEKSNSSQTNLVNSNQNTLLSFANSTTNSNNTTTTQTFQQIMQENSNTIKEALQLPKEFKDLVGQLSQATNKTTANGDNAKQTNGGWGVNENINLELLSEILGKDTKATMDKLVQIMSKNGEINLKTAKSALSTVSDINQTGESQNNQVIKNVLLLYLPYLPFDPNAKNFNFDVTFNSNSSDDISDQGIELLIKTENYGNIKAYLSLGNEKTVNIALNCHKAFPRDLLSKMIQKEADKNKLKVVLNYSDKNQPKQNELGRTNGDGDNKKEIKIKSSTSTVNSSLMLMSYSLIKSVFEIDKG